MDEIEQSVAGVFDAAFAEPLPTDDPDRPLTRPLAMFGVIAQLYTQESWPDLTDAIVAAIDGDGTALLAAADVYWQRTPDGYESNIAESNKAITCLDAQVAPEPESALTLSAEGDGNEIEVTTSDDGTIDVTVTGSAEWTMSGTGEETDGTLVVTGTGTPAQGADVDAALIVDTNGCG